MQSILVNGQATTAVDAHDRGLQFGDGLFETLAVRDGRPCLWQRHMQRLQAGAGRLAIELPPLDTLRHEALSLTAECKAAVLKLIVTRGTGERGYRPPVRPRTTRVLICTDAPEQPPQWQDEGVHIRTCTTILGSNPQLAGVKHLNRLEQVLARAEWDDPMIAEGLVTDGQGRFIEGTATNLFLQQGEQLLTPRLDRCGVRGIMRELVMAQAQALGTPVTEDDMFAADLEAADALYLTNSLIGAWRVRSLATRTFDSSIPTHPAIVEARNKAFLP